MSIVGFRFDTSKSLAVISLIFKRSAGLLYRSSRAVAARAQ